MEGKEKAVVPSSGVEAPKENVRKQEFNPYRGTHLAGTFERSKIGVEKLLQSFLAYTDEVQTFNFKALVSKFCSGRDDALLNRYTNPCCHHMANAFGLVYPLPGDPAKKEAKREKKGTLPCGKSSGVFGREDTGGRLPTERNLGVLDMVLNNVLQIHTLEVSPLSAKFSDDETTREVMGEIGMFINYIHRMQVVIKFFRDSMAGKGSELPATDLEMDDVPIERFVPSEPFGETGKHKLIIVDGDLLAALGIGRTKDPKGGELLAALGVKPLPIFLPNHDHLPPQVSPRQVILRKLTDDAMNCFNRLSKYMSKLEEANFIAFGVKLFPTRSDAYLFVYNPPLSYHIGRATKALKESKMRDEDFNEEEVKIEPWKQEKGKGREGELKDKEILPEPTDEDMERLLGILSDTLGKVSDFLISSLELPKDIAVLKAKLHIQAFQEYLERAYTIIVFYRKSLKREVPGEELETTHLPHAVH